MPAAALSPEDLVVVHPGLQRSPPLPYQTDQVAFHGTLDPNAGFTLAPATPVGQCGEVPLFRTQIVRYDAFGRAPTVVAQITDVCQGDTVGRAVVSLMGVLTFDPTGQSPVRLPVLLLAVSTSVQSANPAVGSPPSPWVRAFFGLWPYHVVWE
jgi:hypothetical protein